MNAGNKGSPPVQKGEGPNAPTSAPLNAKTSEFNSRAVVDNDQGDKLFATLRARAALLGLTLVRLTDGGYLIARQSMTREEPSLTTVGEFLSAWEGRP